MSRVSPGETCLVTGATGFVGGHLARRLARAGRPVRCLARATSDTSLLAGAGSGIELVFGDLTDADSLARAVEGCGSVLHCGAMVTDWATSREIEAVNVGGTRELVRAACRASVRRFVHFSTTDVYARRSNLYALTKQAAEAQVRARAPAAVILRPATVYGPRSTEVVGAIAAALRSGSMLLIDGGRAVAGLCYVDNLVDAAVLALDHPAAPGATFDVSDGLDVTWRQFTADLAHGLGCRPPRFSLPKPVAHGVGFALEHAYRGLRATTGLRTPALLSRQAVHVLGVDQTFSAARLRATLGWEPSVGYDAGLAATLDWLRDDGAARFG